MSVAERWGRFLASGPTVWDAATERRRDCPVMFYSGKNGSGKSLLATNDVLLDLDEGRRVLSTVRLIDWRDPHPCDDRECRCDKDDPSRHLAAHPNYERWQRWDQMLTLRDGVLFADEVTGVADSNDSAGMPQQVSDELHRLRRRDVALRLTGLNFVRAHKRVREACTGVTRCVGSMEVPAFDDEGRRKLWPIRRLVEAVTYDARTLPVDDLTEGAFAKADVIVRARCWVPDQPARLAYDTFESVDRVGTVTEAGACAVCTGRRVRPECSCPDYVEAKARKASRRSASREAASTAAAEPLPEPRWRGDAA